MFLIAGAGGFVPGLTQPHQHPDVMVAAGGFYFGFVRPLEQPRMHRA